jgi:acyl dehydratase
VAQFQPPGFPIERGKIHEFANSLLDDDPLYHDLNAAHAAGLPSVVAPPTFSSAAAFFPDPNARGPSMKGLDMRFLLHGGQELIFERPIFAGDELHSEPGETKSWEKEGKRGGTMKFIENETIWRDQTGEIVLRVMNTLIQTAGVVKE